MWLANCAAHMPTFTPKGTTAKNPFYIASVTEKSWGVYGILEDDPIWFSLDGIKDEEMTISLQRSYRSRAVFDLAVWGPGINNVTCTAGWYGWSRRLHLVAGVYLTRDLSELPQIVKDEIGTEEALVLHGDAVESPEYEPFGVNLYWPIGGCKDVFRETSIYKLALVRPPNNETEKVWYSLGVGMKETFSFQELIFMSFYMIQTFVWGGRSYTDILTLFFVSIFLTYISKLCCCWNLKAKQSIYVHFVWVGASILMASAIVYLSQYLWVLSVAPTADAIIPDTKWIAIIVHIVIPLILSLLMLYIFEPGKKRWKIIGVFFAGLLMLFLAWQAYFVGPLLILIGSFILFIRDLSSK